LLSSVAYCASVSLLWIVSIMPPDAMAGSLALCEKGEDQLDNTHHRFLLEPSLLLR
jgi:hypothetical protein